MLDNYSHMACCCTVSRTDFFGGEGWGSHPKVYTAKMQSEKSWDKNFILPFVLTQVSPFAELDSIRLRSAETIWPVLSSVGNTSVLGLHTVLCDCHSHHQISYYILRLKPLLLKLNLMTGN